MRGGRRIRESETGVSARCWSPSASRNSSDRYPHGNRRTPCHRHTRPGFQPTTPEAEDTAAGNTDVSLSLTGRIHIYLTPSGPQKISTGGGLFHWECLVKIKVTIGVFLLACSVFGQTNRGTVTGTISDTAGAVIPNVPVVLTNMETGAKSETVSTGTGNYSLLQLPVGTYTLTVSKEGFSKYEQTNIQV